MAFLPQVFLGPEQVFFNRRWEMTRPCGIASGAESQDVQQNWIELAVDLSID